MTNYVGGIRTRLIRDSLINTIEDSLRQRGWFDTGRRHLPVTFARRPLDWSDPIDPNTLALSDDVNRSDDAEMGSNLTEDVHTFFVDFYAEDSAIGIDVIHEVKDILRGKIPSIGRGRPVIDIYDYTLATPVVIFRCEVEDVVVDRANGFEHPWTKYWYTCRFDLLDEYGDEDY